MFIALDNVGNRISAENSIQGEKYFCPICGEQLIIKAIKIILKPFNFHQHKITLQFFHINNNKVTLHLIYKAKAQQTEICCAFAL